ncbi:MAG: RNA polymerase sigma factor [Sphingobacteriaceae bacterium]|nr:RNA polymerase sigma factor [Sphingobacteriaceae bacterium]
MSESILIEALQGRERSAFPRLVSSYQKMVFNTALGIIQNKEEAEDVAQEVFVQVYESIGQFKGESKLSTWLYRITLTKALDWQRKKNRKKRFAIVKSLFGVNDELQYDQPDFEHPGILMENKERSVILFKAINTLPENQKVAFLLHKVEGQSHQEIADIMQTTVGAVESYLHRAKQHLRKSLAGYYKNL